MVSFEMFPNLRIDNPGCLLMSLKKVPEKRAFVTNSEWFVTTVELNLSGRRINRGVLGLCRMSIELQRIYKLVDQNLDKELKTGGKIQRSVQRVEV